MKISDINFLDIKKISDKYISLCHYKNNPVIFNINNLEISKLIYKKNNLLYMNFEYELELVRLLYILEKYVCEYVYKKNNVKIDFKDFVEKTLYSSFIKDKNELELQIHKECLILEEDNLLNKKQISHKDLKNRNYCNLKIHFVGINFLENKYEPIFLVRKIIKQIENEENEEDLELALDSDDEDNNILDTLVNDEKITKHILENYEKKQINDI